MTTLRIKNDYSYLITPDQELKAKISSKLRFRKRNYFMNPRYQQKLWDGYYRYFDKKDGKFLTGLLTEVTLILHYLGVKYAIVDERTKVNLLQNEINDQFLNQWLPHGKSPITLEDYQVLLVNNSLKHLRGIVKAPTGSGKAQPLDSLVATPTGFKKMGDIRIGDNVLVPSGGYAAVTGIFPQGKKKILRIKFSHGDSVECCKEHLWKVNATYDDWRGKILDAQALLEKHKCPSGSNRYNIDTPKNLDFEERPTPIEPHMMGLLLGNGCFRGKGTVTISTAEEEILTSIKEKLHKEYKLIKSKSRKHDYRISSGRRGGGVPKNPYVETIKQMGLEGKDAAGKFIPECYLINTYKKRLSLLQGLMDTDGYIDKKGGISYTTVSKDLARDIKWLIQSLGGISRTTQQIKTYRYLGIKKSGKLAYIISFTLPEGVEVCRLKRKLVRMNKTRKGYKTLVIDSVEPAGEKECQCILIDHPEHLYITDNFVITHNTFIAISILKCLHPSTPTLFLANRKQLVKQNYDEMIEWGLQRVGRFDGSVHEPNMITCATVQSAHHLGNLLPKFRALIVDEVHLMMGAQAQEIYKQLTGCSMRLGISATPFKFERKGKKNKNIMVDGDDVHKYNVKGFFGPVLIRDITTKMLQDRGRLSKTKCVFFPITEPQTIKYDVYQDAVTNGIAQNWHFHQVVKKIAEALKGRVLILVERLAHGDTLSQLIPNSLWVQGKDDEETRSHVIKQLSESKEDVVAIATTGIFNTGLNFRVHAMVNAAGGKASHEITQRMGRGLRPADDKEQLLYIDFVFKTHDDLLDHSEDRISILTDEGHDVIVKEQLDFVL